MVLKNYLTIIDYSAIAGTLVFSLGIGVYYGVRGKKTNNEELLVGGRNMGVIPVAASILVSYLSAITILGYPSEVYSFGTQIFFQILMGLPVHLGAIYVFVRTLFDLKLTSAYQYLEMRYDSVAVRWAGSSIFILQLLCTSGIVIYAPAIAMEAIMGIPKEYSVIAIGVCGTIYTSIGGIKAVVITDVFQFLTIFAGMSAIVARGIMSAGGVENMFRIAWDRDRIQLFDWTVDPFMRHNTLNFVLSDIFAICFLCHQPVLQRFCALPTYQAATKSILWCWFFGLVIKVLVIITGIAIFARYANCDPITSNQISKSDQIVPYFVVQELSFIPGVVGLFAAVIFSAVLSTISSTLNSLAAVTWEDFLSRTPCFKGTGDFAQATTYRILTVLYGTLCVVLSFNISNFGNIVQSASAVFGTAVGVLGSIFLMGILLPFVNKYGAIGGLTIAVSTVVFIAINAVSIGKTYDIYPKLPISTEECSQESFFSNVSFTGSLKNVTKLDRQLLEFPEKLYTVSYTLYPLIGGLISVVSGIVISILTGGCTTAKTVRVDCLHPAIRPYWTPSPSKNNVNINDSTKSPTPNFILETAST